MLVIMHRQQHDGRPMADGFDFDTGVRWGRELFPHQPRTRGRYRRSPSHSPHVKRSVHFGRASFVSIVVDRYGQWTCRLPPNSFVRAERVQHLLKVVWKRAREFHAPMIGRMFERQAGRMKERPLEM